MRIARKPVQSMKATAQQVLTIKIDIDQFIAVVARHVELSRETARAIHDELARLLHAPRILVHPKATTRKTETAADSVLSTQAAADLVGVSRPYLVARIEAGDIPVHQQVGSQRRVLRSAVLAWHRTEQTRRRKALAKLGAHLDQEAFPR